MEKDELRKTTQRSVYDSSTLHLSPEGISLWTEENCWDVSQCWEAFGGHSRHIICNGNNITEQEKYQTILPASILQIDFLMLGIFGKLHVRTFDTKFSENVKILAEVMGTSLLKFVHSSPQKPAQEEREYP